MLEKVRERGLQDPLFFHKIGLVLGGFAGLLGGLIISDRADKFELQLEETIDGETEPELIEAAE